MRILVCGSRDYADKEAMREIVARFPEDVVVITGGNGYFLDGARERPCTEESHLMLAHRGADALAYQAAVIRGIEITPVFWADWRKGKKAGPERNQRMLDEGKPDCVIAFPIKNSVGTWDMVRRARKAGVPVEIQEYAK